MEPEAVLVVSTFPDREQAQRIARMLVEEKQAACANLIGGGESIYRWQGKIETAAEVLVFFKLPKSVYPQFEERLRALHPYEVPEIVCLNINAGLPEYLRWVVESCAGGQGQCAEPAKQLSKRR